MKCNLQVPGAGCVNKAAWLVEDNVSAKVWAACDMHVAHFLGRVNLVTRIEENGKNMQAKKGMLDESYQPDAR